jgi:hypothetical protein
VACSTCFRLLTLINLNPELRDLLSGKPVYRKEDLVEDDADKNGAGDGELPSESIPKKRKPRKKSGKDSKEEKPKGSSQSQKSSTHDGKPCDEASERPEPPPSISSEGHAVLDHQRRGDGQMTGASSDVAMIGPVGPDSVVPDSSQKNASLPGGESSESEPPVTDESFGERSDASVPGLSSGKGFRTLGPFKG